MNSEIPVAAPTTTALAPELVAAPLPTVVTPMTTGQAILLRRLEVKYVIDRPTRTALARDLAALMRPDTHGDPTGVYLVRSLYLDTPDFMAYHEKLSGATVRHKLRVRVYGQDPSQTPHVRLEVKSRYSGFIHKITAEVPWEDYGDIELALKRRTLPPARLLNSNSTQEFFRLQRQYNMEPKIIVQYRRQAFERKEVSRASIS